MTVASALLIAAVVLAVRLVPSLRFKAAVYSLPIPMTLALVGSGGHVDARHLLGVVMLVLFFVAVSVLHHRYGLHILLADGLALLAYLLLAWPLAALGRMPFLPTLVAVCGLWAITAARRPPAVPVEGTPPGRPGLLSVMVVVGTALLMAPLGGVLQSFVVTFPYSGVLVVVETRRSLPAFTRQFARASLALVAFLAAYHFAEPYGRGWALATAWAAHLTTAGLLLATARTTPAR